jgi:C-terminal processing protease CtpA/Prc
MRRRSTLLSVAGVLVLVTLACQFANNLVSTAATPTQPPSPTPQSIATLRPTLLPSPTPTPSPTSTPSPTAEPSATPGSAQNQSDEPVTISGDIPYTSPFFLNTISEPFVMLEDEAGFVRRDPQFVFPIKDQVLGPVIVHSDNTLTYELTLPALPQGIKVDVDNNGKQDPGVEVFAVAYWSNTWDGPFLEQRDGTGWSTGYASTMTDPERDNEINGGILVVWSPDDKQGFPTGFGNDNKLFTTDDPTAPIPAGYNLVDLNQEPFKVYKEANPEITLNEGEGAINDYSKLSYVDAFDALFKKVSVEYPFTQEKHIDWQALYAEFAPQVASAQNDDDFYRAIKAFTLAIPDTHVGVSFNPTVFREGYGGGFGLVLAELSDGSIIVTQVIPNTPGADAGIEVGAEIVTWDGQSVQDAINQVVPFFGPFSTELDKHLKQIMFLERVPPNTQVQVEYKNPGSAQTKKVTMRAIIEVDSLVTALAVPGQDEMSLPLDAHILSDSGLGYIRIDTFSDDYTLMASLWDRFMGNLIDNKVPGLILDLRHNPGGSLDIAIDFADYFFNQEIDLSHEAYYNDLTKQFEFQPYFDRIQPAPKYYDGPIAVLVSTDCVSACEGFSNAMTQNSRAMIVGHYPTAGAFGEVGRGQFDLPGGISMQFPTGKALTPDGKLLIEGQGVALNITVPVTEDDALGKVDAVLQAAENAIVKP